MNSIKRYRHFQKCFLAMSYEGRRRCVGITVGNGILNPTIFGSDGSLLSILGRPSGLSRTDVSPTTHPGKFSIDCNRNTRLSLYIGRLACL